MSWPSTPMAARSRSNRSSILYVLPRLHPIRNSPPTAPSGAGQPARLAEATARQGGRRLGLAGEGKSNTIKETMTDKFFSRKVSWKRVRLVSFITTLVVLAAGFLFWYFFLYLPLAQHLSENQKIDKELRQLYELKGLPPDSSPIPE